MIEDRQDRQLLAVFLIAVGALWLLVSIGYIPVRVATAALSLWPVLAIGIGLDLLHVRRAAAGLPWSALAAAVVVVLALLGAPFGLGASATELSATEPLAGARSAAFEFDLGPAPTTIRAAADPETLIAAEVRDSGRVRLDVRGQRDKTVMVTRRRPGFAFAPGLAGAAWQLALNPRVPVTLAVDAGSGRTTADLRGLHLERLVYDGGSGFSELRLPVGTYGAAFDLGSGRTEVSLEAGATANLEVATGSGASAWTLPSGGAVRLALDSGSGSVTIDVPDDAAILVTATDRGSGGLRLPPWLERVGGSGETGQWRSLPARTEQPEVTIEINGAGSGSITIR